MSYTFPSVCVERPLSRARRTRHIRAAEFGTPPYNRSIPLKFRAEDAAANVPPGRNGESRCSHVVAVYIDEQDLAALLERDEVRFGTWGEKPGLRLYQDIELPPETVPLEWPRRAAPPALLDLE